MAATDDPITEAARLKAEGTAHFKSKDFGAAQEKYSKALRVLNKAEAAAPKPRSSALTAE